MVIPPGIASLPRFPLLDGPSPLAPLPRFSAALGGSAEVWIKREDLLPLAFGGNKLRNLEFLVGAALAEGADTLVTSGRRWSNHCRLTAAAGARAGHDVHLILSGPPVDPPGANQRLDELLGATVHVAATDDRAERAALVDRVKALWVSRLEAVESGRARPTELAPFGWWFASKKFDDRWALEQLRRVLELGVYPDLDHAVAERLGELADSRPLEALHCLKLMVAGDDADEGHAWRALRCRRGITQALASGLKNPDKAVASAAHAICRPARTSNRVVLPAPDRPVRAHWSPWSNCTV
jgi:hypothetical protein